MTFGCTLLKLLGSWHTSCYYLCNKVWQYRIRNTIHNLANALGVSCSNARDGRAALAVDEAHDDALGKLEGIRPIIPEMEPQSVSFFMPPNTIPFRLLCSKQRI